MKSGAETLKAICRMAEDDNKGLKMTITVNGVYTQDNISTVTFQVDKDVIASADLQSFGIEGDYMCCAFFIDRKELRKYKKAMQ